MNTRYTCGKPVLEGNVMKNIDSSAAKMLSLTVACCRFRGARSGRPSDRVDIEDRRRIYDWIRSAEGDPFLWEFSEWLLSLAEKDDLQTVLKLKEEWNKVVRAEMTSEADKALRCDQCGGKGYVEEKADADGIVRAARVCGDGTMRGLLAPGRVELLAAEAEHRRKDGA
jgi:hypothetical protein